MAPRAVLLLVAAACVGLVAGHGRLATPPARNVIYDHVNLFYNPNSLNGGGPQGLCGAEQNVPGDARFELPAGYSATTYPTEGPGSFAGKKIVATYTQGQVITTNIEITTHHNGRMELRLCPLAGTGPAAEAAGLSEACFQANPLYRPFVTYDAAHDGLSSNYQYLTPEVYSYETQWLLPPNVTCEHCVLQWRYVTSHECIPQGMNMEYARSISAYDVRPCDYSMDAGMPVYLRPIEQVPGATSDRVPEKFYNCADIAIVPAGASLGTVPVTGSNPATTGAVGSSGRKMLL